MSASMSAGTLRVADPDLGKGPLSPGTCITRSTYCARSKQVILLIHFWFRRTAAEGEGVAKAFRPVLPGMLAATYARGGQTEEVLVFACCSYAVVEPDVGNNLSLSWAHISFGCTQHLQQGSSDGRFAIAAF